MVAIVMTEDGPEVDPLGNVPTTAATEPPMSEAEFKAYMADVLRRDLTEVQRAAAGVAVLDRIPPRLGGDRRSLAWRDRRGDAPWPPTQAQVARLLGISVASISRMRAVRNEAPPALAELVARGQVPVFTALRVAREFSPDRQDEFVRRAARAADPAKLVTTMQAEARSIRRDRPVRTDNRSPDRHQYVTTAALRSLSNSLDALRLVLESTDGLDPALTPEEAARWLDGLSKGRRSIGGVVKLLTERKESTT